MTPAALAPAVWQRQETQACRAWACAKPRALGAWCVWSFGAQLFMRLSVLACDVAVFVTAVVAAGRLLPRLRGMLPNGSAVEAFHTQAALLLCPVAVLIDHGHFQYNCVALGLLLWAVAAAWRGMCVCVRACVHLICPGMAFIWWRLVASTGRMSRHDETNPQSLNLAVAASTAHPPSRARDTPPHPCSQRHGFPAVFAAPWR